jgi:hypothetical protein
MIFSLEAAVGQHEHIFGVEPPRNHVHGLAVGRVRAGGLESGGLPQRAAEETGQLADQETGSAALPC